MATLAVLLGAAWLTAAPIDRPAAVILREFDAVQYPSMSEGSDPESIAKFEREIREAAERQQALALELAAAHRDHPRVAETMRLRWTLFSTVQEDGETVLRETAEWLAGEPDAAIVAAAAATRALAAMTVTELGFAQRRAILAESLAAAPDEKLVAESLVELARKHTAEPALQRELLAEVRERCRDLDYLSREITQLEQLGARIGRPLDLRFAGADEDRSADAPRTIAEWRGRPCLVRSRGWTPGWLGDEERSEIAALAELRRRRSAAELPLLAFVQVYDAAPAAPVVAASRAQGFAPLWVDRSGFETSIAKEQLGLDRDGCWLLVDCEGCLRAWSWRLEALAPKIEEVFAAPPGKPAKKRRAI